MLVTDKIIYIELHKTGSTHTRAILAEMFNGAHTILGKHDSLNSILKESLGDVDKKIKIGNIRNPWDWYVSLWSYGCQQKGGLYRVLTQKRNAHKVFSKNGVKYHVKKLFSKKPNAELVWLNPKIWQNLYSDSNNYYNFNERLKLILTGQNIQIGEGYKASSLSGFAGFLTYRYLNLYTSGNNINKIKDFQDLFKYDAEENYMDEIIKMESLNKDLLNIVKTTGYNEQLFQEILNNYQLIKNSSTRNKDYRVYYNNESVELVAQFERLIIEKYNYKFTKV